MVENADINSFELLQTLGTGTFGRVRLARTAEGELVALKMLKKAEIVKLKQVDHVFSEFSILKTISHPFIANMLAWSQDERYLYFVLEYVPGGELFSYLQKSRSLDQQQARLYAGQIVQIFEYFHSMDIVYRDLKPENILIGLDGYLKLTDFGFAKVVTGRTFTLCGTPEYLAPEILLNKGHGKPVDWWTLGVFIYEMLVGIDPFSDSDTMAIYQKILKGKIKFPRNFDSNAKSLIKHLLVIDVTKRFGATKNGSNDIKNHRWFISLDWVRLLRKAIDMPYNPKLKAPDDISHFASYPDSGTLTPAVRPPDDIFADW